MPLRDEWSDLARKLDWSFSYVEERDVYPEELAGTPWLPGSDWRDWDEPFRSTFAEYVTTQHKKEVAFQAVAEAVGRVEDLARLDPGWLSAVKLHVATLPLAEFAAVIGNLRAARFGRDSAWRMTSLLGALDELRHTQLPLRTMHDLVRWDEQFEWTHRLFHSEDWIAIAGRHLVDELLLGSDAIEFAVGTHFVFETGFTNLQFIGLTAMARQVGDRLFERMLQSIQTDEARHAQIGIPVLRRLVAVDPERAQRLVDKWFWRSFRFFAVVTGIAMDYLTPLEARRGSFKEFVEEWVVEQFRSALDELGLKLPKYWQAFLDALPIYHHMLYVSAYSYRATTWFDFVLPGPRELDWLSEKYPDTFPQLVPLWHNVAERWRAAGPGVEWFSHGTTPVAFCNLCQLVLCAGTPSHNQALFVEREGRTHVFCSQPCRELFELEPERYAAHRGVVERILGGQAPANLLELLRHFGLSEQSWGRDVVSGDYPFLSAEPPESETRRS
jgi:toluene monooxygenase system protein A